jgi:trimethylamine--corrinoid protein Co-methyltransferase
MAFDAIARVGPGGYFMKDPHTLRHFRSENLFPKIAMQPAAPGSREEPMAVLARKEAKRLLKEHKPPELEKSIQKQALEMLAKYDHKIINAAVPTDYLSWRK